MDGAVELPFHLLLFYDVFGVKVEKKSLKYIDEATLCD